MQTSELRSELRLVVGFVFSLVLSVKVVDQLQRVYQEFCRFPSDFAITNQMNKEFQSFADKFGIKYFFHLEFNVVVNDDSGWGSLFLSREWVASYGFK